MSNARRLRPVPSPGTRPAVPLEAAARELHDLLQTALPAAERVTWERADPGVREQTLVMAATAVTAYRLAAEARPRRGALAGVPEFRPVA